MLDYINDICNNIGMKHDSITKSEKSFHHQGDESHLLREVFRVHQAILAVFSREVGVTAARVSLVRLIANNHPEPSGVMELAHELGINAAAVTRQVKELEGEGIISRCKHAHDARRSGIMLTPEGLKIVQQVHARLHKFEKDIGEHMEIDELNCAIKVLEKLRCTLDGMKWRK